MNLLVLTLLAAQQSAQPAAAWDVLTNDAGYELQWASMPIEYRVNTANSQGLTSDEVTAAITSSAKEWETAEDSEVTFNDAGATTEAATDYGDANLIYFEDAWEFDASLLALTANWSNASTGEILGFDIRINAEDHQWTTTGEDGKSDLQNMLTHEIGHVLGLDHTDVDTEAAMYGTAVTGEVVKRDIKWDDQAGAAYLYGAGLTDANSSLLGCSTATSGAVTPSRGGAGGFGFLLVLGVMLRRSRADPMDGRDSPESLIKHS